MKTQSRDTRPAAERVQIDLLRRASPAHRFGLARSLSRTMLGLARRSIRRGTPGADETAIGVLFIARHYGQALARHVQADLAGREMAIVGPPDILAALTPVVEAFETLAIPYYIGGSVASSVYGFPRATADVDLVADVNNTHVRALGTLLRAAYYVDPGAIREAIRDHISFNLIHLSTMIKIDVFVPKARAHEREVRSRLRQEALDDDTGRSFYLASAEDIVLAKLEWFELGNRVSDRQWNDVVGVLKTQGAALDLAYLRRWASRLALAELLATALDDAGLT